LLNEALQYVGCWPPVFIVQILDNGAPVSIEYIRHRRGPKLILGAEMVENKRMGNPRSFGYGACGRPIKTENTKTFQRGLQDTQANIIAPLLAIS